MRIEATPYLTWEYCDDPEIQYLNCPHPEAMRNHMPDWFKRLKAKHNDIDIAEQQTIRNCLGFRGITNIGYTIPLPEDLDAHDTYFARGRVQPAMIKETIFSRERPEPWYDAQGEIMPRLGDDDHERFAYRLRLLHYPWRAKMSKGWRLIILPYLMDWSNDWTEFAGSVEPNYNVSQDQCNIGSSMKWSIPIDREYNYYNLETVIAYKRNVQVKKGTLTFCAVPLFDPDLLDKQTKGV